jgi:hypothetical protein
MQGLPSQSLQLLETAHQHGELRLIWHVGGCRNRACR